ncbi:hypothetical protein lerEdw1_015897 [Lerista edwardsae]|nr:hypothetical protein lerEdw1_015897 [Lerista edwardsae]
MDPARLGLRVRSGVAMLVDSDSPPPRLAALKSSRAAQERSHILGAAMRRGAQLGLVSLLSLLGVACGVLTASGGNVVSRDGHEKVTILQECPAWPGALRGQLGEGVVLARGDEELNALHCKQGAKNCKELLAKGVVLSGWYTVYPKDCAPLTVLCDMDTDGGGWTVFQRRADDSVDFYRDWSAYKRGFGSQLTEFWLGNDNIHLLTSLGEHELRVDLTDFNNNRTFAQYQSFKILGESDQYRLVLGGFRGGTAGTCSESVLEQKGDSLSYHNNMDFSTKDHDNDTHQWNCAKRFKGGWWYKSCHYSNLNGLYFQGASTQFGTGVNWRTGKGYQYSYKHSEMKFRPSV